MAEKKEKLNTENKAKEEINEEVLEGQSTEECNEKVLEGEVIEEENTEKAGETDGDMKKKEKKSKKDKKDELIDELKDRVARQMAEFDNFRKRTTKEKAQMYEIGAKEVLEKLLPTIDNFERGIASLSEEEKSSKFAVGMIKVYENMMSSLEEMGVAPIEAVGKEFNLNLHNAVIHEDDESQEENMIVQELQKGYMYKEIVLRHSMVKVVN